jgi:hypothetical protein
MVFKFVVSLLMKETKIINAEEIYKQTRLIQTARCTL